MRLPAKTTAITPHLTVRDVEKAVLFYEQGFGFRVKLKLPGGATNRIMHAEVEHEGCTVMLGPESPDRGMLAPITRGTPPSINLYLAVPSVDEAHARAVQAGATELLPPSDQFFGARTSVVADPDGHQWMLSEQREEMSEQELRDALRKGTDHSAKDHSGPPAQTAPRRRRFKTT